MVYTVSFREPEGTLINVPLEDDKADNVFEFVRLATLYVVEQTGTEPVLQMHVSVSYTDRWGNTTDVMPFHGGDADLHGGLRSRIQKLKGHLRTGGRSDYGPFQG